MCGLKLNFRSILLYLSTLSLLTELGCSPPRFEDYEGRTWSRESSESRGRSEQQQIPLALVGEVKISLEDYQGFVEELSPMGLARLNSSSDRSRFLEGMVALYVLAHRAEELGLDRDPAVIYAGERAIAEEVFARERGAGVDREEVSEDELASHYRENLFRFQRSAMLRAILILVDSEEEANSIRREYRQRIDTTMNASIELARRLVQDHSIDEFSRVNGGDLGFFARGTDPGLLAPELFDPLETLRNYGNVTVPVRTVGGWAILILVQRQQAIERSLEDVRELLRDEFTLLNVNEARATWQSELRAGAEVEIDSELLQELDDSLVMRRGAADLITEFSRQPTSRLQVQLRPQYELSSTFENLAILTSESAPMDQPNGILPGENQNDGTDELP